MTSRLILMMVLIAVICLSAGIGTASAYETVGPVEIRGQVFTSMGAAPISWDSGTFSGFYYDFDDGIGSERLWIDTRASAVAPITYVAELESYLSSAPPHTIAEGKLVYSTSPEPVRFEFESFGWYDVIGFMAEPYFTGFLVSGDPSWFGACTSSGIEAQAKVYDISTIDLFSQNNLSKVLIDSGDKYTIATGAGLELKEGYVFNVQQVDGTKALIELTKDGKVVDTQVVYPDQTGTTNIGTTKIKTDGSDLYVYETKVGDKADTPIIIVHIETVFRGTDTNVVIIEGVFQISDTVTTVDTGDKFGIMEVTTVNDAVIEMTNKESAIPLNQNTTNNIFGTVGFRTADESTTIRFYPLIEYTEPGTYEIRGEIFDSTGADPLSWNHDTFSGFYYDLDNDVGAEQLWIDTRANSAAAITGLAETETYLSLTPPHTITEGKLVYRTTRQPVRFEFESLGWYDVIGFMAEPYFTGFSVSGDPTSLAGSAARVTSSGLEAQAKVYDISTIDLFSQNDLSKVLIDSGDKYTIATGDGLELKEGYVLNVQQVDLDGNKALIELTKDGKVVDTQVVYPDQTGTNNIGTTKIKTDGSDLYVYETKVGDKADTPIIIVHIETVFRGTDTNVVTIEGVFQISDTVTTVEAGDEFGIMEVTKSGGPIVMTNKDNTISLSQDSTKNLFGNLGFRTADDSAVTRFYPFTEATIVDIIQPALTITSPADGATTHSSAITISGTASDDGAIASVRVNGILAAGTTNWGADITLTAGTNTITAIATDTSGNIATKTITITYTPAAGTLTGDVNGDGILSSVDALMALQMSAGNIAEDLAADVNGDGNVTSLDALMILQASVGAIVL